jgi:ammonium transporter Rh
MGGSMYVHTFGAYFGLAASYFFKKPAASKMIKAGGHANLAEGGYTSQYVAMIGTLFLWMFWPSFNGALAIAYQQQRVIVNTVLAISSSCICAIGTSRLWYGKLDMEVVLNATLAGGVSIGSSSDLVVTGAIAMAIGGFAGIVSAIGFLWLGGKLQEKIGLYDTCGIHNLHGMPGVLGGLIGVFSAAFSGSAFEEGSAEQFNAFPAMAPSNGEPGRTAGEQGTAQFLALIITLAISMFGGALSGFIASKVGSLEDDAIFDDQAHFMHVPSDYNVDEYVQEAVKTAGKGHADSEAKEKREA